MAHTMVETRRRAYVVTYYDTGRPVERIFTDHITAVAFAESLASRAYKTDIRIDGRPAR